MPEYRLLKGTEDYRVGDDGSVWSRRERVHVEGKSGYHSSVSEEWHQLKTRPGLGGYLQVVIRIGGKQKCFFVHRLVLEAFVGPCPPGMEACHDPDPSPTNSNLTNLRWGTKKSNQADRVKHGTDCRGEKHPSVKLTAKKVIEIRTKYATGTTSQRKLAKEYQMHQTTIGNIVRREIWPHLEQSNA